MEEISAEKLMELFADTLQKCGTYLLNEDDQVIGYNIFEEFDIGVTSFLHPDSLQRLNDAGLISDEIMEKSSILRSLVQELQQGSEWNINAIRHSPRWLEVLELADEIKTCME